MILNNFLVFNDFIKNHIADFQCLDAVVYCDRRLCVVDYRLVEAFQFRHYRVDWCHLRLLYCYLFARTVGEVYRHCQRTYFSFNVVDSHYVGLLVEEVYCDVCVFLEDTMTTHVLQ